MLCCLYHVIAGELNQMVRDLIYELRDPGKETQLGHSKRKWPHRCRSSASTSLFASGKSQKTAKAKEKDSMGPETDSEEFLNSAYSQFVLHFVERAQQREQEVIDQFLAQKGQPNLSLWQTL